MNPRALIASSVFLLAAGVLPTAAQSTQAAPGELGGSLQGRGEAAGYRVRGAYLSSNDLALLEPAVRAGIDTLVVGFRGMRAPLDATNHQALISWATTCERHGLAFWPVVHYFSAFEPAWVGPYPRYVNGDGDRARHTPCPLDEGFWRRSAEARVLELAALSRQYPITGIVLDPELYDADLVHFVNVCYCGDCVARTLQDAGQGALPPYPDARREWLAGRGLLERHYDVARQTMRRMAEQTRGRVAAIAPGLLIGACAIDQGQPLAEGMVLGFGRPDRPVWVFSESTYIPGYTAYVRQAQQRMQQAGGHARMLCGIWQSKFPPWALAAHLYECARNSSGYWVYTLETFRRPDYSPLRGPAEEYWAAIRRANDELERFAADPHYATTLQIEPFVLPPEPVTSRGVEQLNLVPLSPPTGQAIPPAYWRGNNIFYLYGTAGRQITFPVRLEPVGQNRDGAQYLLVAPDGRVEMRGDLLEVGRPVEVEFHAAQAGLYALVVGAGRNVIQVAGSQPYAVAANPATPARLFIFIPPLLLLTRPEARQVTLELGVPGEAERVRVVISQGGQVRFEQVLADVRKAVVPIDPAPADRILKLDVQRVPGAVRENFSLAVVSGAYPFVALSPEGLVCEP